MPEDLPPCTECGRCCAHGYVVLIQSEEEAEGIPVEMLREGDPSRPNDYLRPGEVAMDCRNGRCVALSGKIGFAVSCRIYSTRPQMCRTYERGSKDCLKVISSSRLRESRHRVEADRRGLE